MYRLVSKTFHAGLALLLSLWVAGAGCMFGCGEMSAATASERLPKAESNALATIVSGDACAAHGAHDCCAKRKAEASQAKTQNTKRRLPLKLEARLTQREALSNIPANGVVECPLALSRAIAISKVGDRRDLAVVSAVVVEPFATLPSSEFKATVTPAARLPNLGHTYLRCCVFLI
jgi:hypothetical protein